MRERNGRFAGIPVLFGLLVLTGCIAGSKPAPIRVGTLCHRADPSCNLVSGFSGNVVSGEVGGATISGGGQRGAPNQVTAEFGSVGGGAGNVAGEGSTVAGGTDNTAIHFNATVGGGANNVASAQEATVAGGFKNVASQRFATVGGGGGNIASEINSTVGGGSGNSATFTFATVGGGTQNLASSTAAVVAGGEHNRAQGAYSAVLGGLNNSGEAYMSTVGGGAGNAASGSYSTVLGGFANSAAGDYSLAAGRKAQVQADDPGAFLFADSSALTFPSIAPNEFAVRATGGVRFVTAIDAGGGPLAGVRLSAGSGAWESLSDASAKSGFATVDETQLLDRLSTLPVMTWYYRSQDPSIRHIGPTAQDFRAAFNLGQDGQYISSVDADGVALAAVKALYGIVQDSEDSVPRPNIQSLERRLAYSNAVATVSLIVAGLALWKRTNTRRPIARAA